MPEPRPTPVRAVSRPHSACRMWIGGLPSRLQVTLGELAVSGRLGPVLLDTGAQPGVGPYDWVVVTVHTGDRAAPPAGLAGRIWLPVLLASDAVLVGPATVPTASSLSEPPVTFGEPAEVSADDLVRALRLAAKEAAALLAGGHAPTQDGQLRIPLAVADLPLAA